MRVGIDLLSLVPNNVGGAEIYARMVLGEIPRVDETIDYTLFTNLENAKTFDTRGAFNVHEIVSPIRAMRRSTRIFYDYLALPRQARKSRIDVLFSPNYTTPVSRHFASVAAILDMRHVDLPDTFSRTHHLVHSQVVALAARTATQIVTLSEHAKARIVDVYRIAPERVSVTYLAANPVYADRVSEDEIRRVQQKYAIPGPYILSVASLFPHKNLDALLDAIIALRQSAAPDVHLVLVGLENVPVQREAAGALRAKMRAANIEDRVIITGWVPDADLPALYQGATVYVLPSRYEGFGLPVLEAMASGTPVITTTAASLPEIAGDAALLFNPDDRAELLRALRRVLEDATLRAELIARGTQRARLFSWRRTAEATLAAFHRANDRAMPHTRLR